MAYQQIDLTPRARQTLLAEAIASVEKELELPEAFPPEVLADAERAVAEQPLPPKDLTGVAFVTIDPPGSTDLDQAVQIERDGDGYTVRYAIADVPSFVAEGGPLDAETLRRGQTLYLPDRRIPLHPEIISERAGSLLPGRRRSAYVWTFALDAVGAVVATGLERAVVESREQLDYASAQAAIDAGGAPDTLQLLREVGLRRIALEHERGGASLRLPQQEVEVDDAGDYRLVARAPLPVEDWNAQISLLTGMEAARIMIEGGVGILRTMPAPDGHGERQFRLQASALGHEWRRDVHYGDFLRSLDVSDPRQMALMYAATSLFRGADYTPFDGEPPAETVQAAIAAPYAHTTAPLRRLVDRFVLVVCEHLGRGVPVPEGIRAALPLLPGAMRASNQISGRLERAAVDAVEAALLHGRVGERFEGVVVDGPTPEQAGKARNSGRPPSGTVQITEPSISARVEGHVEVGAAVTVELVRADIVEHTVLFRVVDGRS
ncbi:RNB domain-containing ribonuclease [Arthrobacter halodurans]|uniref:RNB domain-containing ribonuclease n=1 Tax=Arthrobacter halodurans TaxID=516699 RepID=A0ABV4URR0_9MICC